MSEVAVFSTNRGLQVSASLLQVSERKLQPIEIIDECLSCNKSLQVCKSYWKSLILLNKDFSASLASLSPYGGVADLQPPPKPPLPTEVFGFQIFLFSFARAQRFQNKARVQGDAVGRAGAANLAGRAGDVSREAAFR